MSFVEKLRKWFLGSVFVTNTVQAHPFAIQKSLVFSAFSELPSWDLVLPRPSPSLNPPRPLPKRSFQREAPADDQTEFIEQFCFNWFSLQIWSPVLLLFPSVHVAASQVDEYAAALSFRILYVHLLGVCKQNQNPLLKHMRPYVFQSPTKHPHSQLVSQPDNLVTQLLPALGRTLESSEAKETARLYLSKPTHPKKAAPTWQKALAAWLKFWPFPFNIF